MNKFVYRLISFLSTLAAVAVGAAVMFLYYMLLLLTLVLLMGGTSIVIQLVGLIGTVAALSIIIKVDRFADLVMDLTATTVRNFLYRCFSVFERV
jgi:hypothetical protein